ncbi:DUF6289 family protein [Brevundimonas sp. LjRoot202]|uniref:DUF6289 family protein n=1 Tax=Brevundimonas sp. LjRoot202 TaxID=3342281 RepID=UPI003F4F5E76
MTATAVASATVQNCPSQVDRTYYSDATLSEDVGSIYIDCDRQIYRTGQITPYFTENYLPCNCGPIEW